MRWIIQCTLSSNLVKPLSHLPLNFVNSLFYIRKVYCCFFLSPWHFSKAFDTVAYSFRTNKYGLGKWMVRWVETWLGYWCQWCKVQLAASMSGVPWGLLLTTNPYSGRRLSGDGQGRRAYEAQNVTQGVTDHSTCKDVDFVPTQRGQDGVFWCR